MKEIMELVIKRSEWIRSDPMSMYMLYPNGSKCVLGFLGEKLGLESIVLMDCYPREKNLWPEWLFEIDKNSGRYKYYQIANINDSLKLTDEEIEEKLAAIFASNNIELSFVD